MKLASSVGFVIGRIENSKRARVVRIFLRTLVAAFLLVFAFPSFLLAQSNEASEVFELQDFLGRTWRNESVSFAASTAQLASARAGLPLIGPDQKPVLYQIVEGSAGAPPAIEFLADLDPFEKRAYHFARASRHAAAATDLKIEETLGNDPPRQQPHRNFDPQEVGRGARADRKRSLGVRSMDWQFAAARRSTCPVLQRKLGRARSGICRNNLRHTSLPKRAPGNCGYAFRPTSRWFWWTRSSLLTTRPRFSCC